MECANKNAVLQNMPANAIFGVHMWGVLVPVVFRPALDNKNVRSKVKWSYDHAKVRTQLKSWMRFPGGDERIRIQGLPAALVVAALALIIGGLVYVWDRGAGSAMLLPHFIGHQPGAPLFFGYLGGSLPSFVHVLAFALLTAVILGHGWRARFIACVSWGLIGGLVELGQHSIFKFQLAHHLPAVFGNYFLHGTFDPIDVLATLLGVLTAGLLHFAFYRGEM